jgi:hypothetical protein
VDFSFQIVLGGKAHDRGFVLDLYFTSRHEYSLMNHATVDHTVTERVLPILVRQALQFLWTGKTGSAAKTFTKWSNLCKDLKNGLRRARDKICGSTNTDPAGLAQQLLALVTNRPPDDAEDGTREVMQAFEEVCGDIASFMKTNRSNVPVKFHPIVASAVGNAYTALCESKLLTLHKLVEAAAVALADDFKFTWL